MRSRGCASTPPPAGSTSRSSSSACAAPRAQRRPVRRADRHEWIVFLQVNALLVAIWAFAGAGYFWPAWVIAWWGFALLLKTAPRVLRLR
jgi:hypothetical protein